MFGIANASQDVPFGILGIGPYLSGNPQYPFLIDNLKTQGFTQSRAFSLDLRGSDSPDGSIIFGAIDTGKYEGNLEKIPMIPATSSPDLKSRYALHPPRPPPLVLSPMLTCPADTGSLWTRSLSPAPRPRRPRCPSSSTAVLPFATSPRMCTPPSDPASPPLVSTPLPTTTSLTAVSRTRPVPSISPSVERPSRSPTRTLCGTTLILSASLAPSPAAVSSFLTDPPPESNDPTAVLLTILASAPYPR